MKEQCILTFEIGDLFRIEYDNALNYAVGLAITRCLLLLLHPDNVSGIAA